MKYKGFILFIEIWIVFSMEILRGLNRDINGITCRILIFLREGTLKWIKEKLNGKWNKPFFLKAHRPKSPVLFTFDFFFFVEWIVNKIKRTRNFSLYGKACYIILNYIFLTIFEQSFVLNMNNYSAFQPNL